MTAPENSSLARVDHANRGLRLSAEDLGRKKTPRKSTMAGRGSWRS